MKAIFYSRFSFEDGVNTEHEIPRWKEEVIKELEEHGVDSQASCMISSGRGFVLGRIRIKTDGTKDLILTIVRNGYISETYNILEGQEEINHISHANTGIIKEAGQD